MLLKGASEKVIDPKKGFLDSLISVALPLTKNVFTSLPKTVTVTVATSAIQKKIYGSGMTTLIISNEEIDNTMEIVQSLEESGLLIRDVSETIQNEAKEQKGGFLGML